MSGMPNLRRGGMRGTFSTEKQQRQPRLTGSARKVQRITSGVGIVIRALPLLSQCINHADLQMMSTLGGQSLLLPPDLNTREAEAWQSEALYWLQSSLSSYVGSQYDRSSEFVRR
eukprot:scaffold2403_cov91-Skeletonema_marinoi.AAC.1